jgi:hypothetical protein
MVVSNSGFFFLCVEEGKVVMEGLIEKNEGIEDKNEPCEKNGGRIETFADLIEEQLRYQTARVLVLRMKRNHKY